MIGGRIGLLICLVPWLVQCSPERLLIVNVDVSKEVLAPAVQLDARTSMDSYLGATTFDLIDQAGKPKPLPFGIGIYHHQRAGDLTIRVHALNMDRQRIAGGSVDFTLSGKSVDEVTMVLSLTPCLDPDIDTAMDTTVCAMPAPPDGGDAGDGGDFGDANDGGNARDAVETGDMDDAGDAGGTGDSSDGATGCPASDAAALVLGDAGATPPACETYCAAALATCPDLFPRLPSPTAATGDPAPIDICRLACTASHLADDTGPGIKALSCRTTAAMVADGSPASCMNASLIVSSCNLPDCVSFCQLNQSVCGVPYDDCKSICPRNLGSITAEPTGDTLTCRLIWLQRAIFDPADCAAAQPQPTCGPCRSGQ